MPPPTVLAAKLTPPRLAHAVLRRGQLEAVQRGAGVRVLYVQAPAGYGKTTLLAEAARRLRWDHVWYRFDVLDADTLGLVAGLTESLRSLSPSFGESLRPLIAGDETPSLAGLAARFIGELERLHVRDLHLILDDYHEVAGRDDVNALLDLLLLDLPPGVHVVFASRSKPAFSTGKLRAAGELRTLGPADLRFTRRQAEAVLGALGSEPSAERLDALLETTGGWAAGVVLAGRVADLAGVTQAATDGLPGGAASSVFDYLTEEVLRRLPDDAVRLVEGTCCLPYVTPRIAARLTGVEQAKRVLDGLVSGGVFTTADEREETYQYHDLFAAYLRVRVQARGGGQALRDLMRRTAGALAAEGHLLRAVAAFLDAEDLDGVLDLVRATWGQALAVCGRPLLERLAETLSVAGAGYADWLPLVRTGIANRLEASPLLPDEAAAAAARLAARGDRPAAFIGYILACRRALRLADFAAACAQADAAAQVADGDEPRAEALRWQALSSIYALRWDDAQEAVERLERCAGAASPAQLVQARAMRVSSLIYAGELAKAAADASIVAPRMLEAGSARSAAGFYSLVGQLYACLAEYETAARAIDTGLELCELEDAAAQRPNLLDSRGFLLASQGRFAEAIALLEECAVSPLAATDLSFEVMVATHLGTSLRRGGDLLAAIEWYRRAAEAALDDLSYEKMNARINFVYASGQAGGPQAGAPQAGGRGRPGRGKRSGHGAPRARNPERKPRPALPGRQGVVSGGLAGVAARAAGRDGGAGRNGGIGPDGAVGRDRAIGPDGGAGCDRAVDKDESDGPVVAPGRRAGAARRSSARSLRARPPQLRDLGALAAARSRARVPRRRGRPRPARRAPRGAGAPRRRRPPAGARPVGGRGGGPPDARGHRRPRPGPAPASGGARPAASVATGAAPRGRARRRLCRRCRRRAVPGAHAARSRDSGDARRRRQQRRDRGGSRPVAGHGQDPRPQDPHQAARSRPATRRPRLSRAHRELEQRGGAAGPGAGARAPRARAPPGAIEAPSRRRRLYLCPSRVYRSIELRGPRSASAAMMPHGSQVAKRLIAYAREAKGGGRGMRYAKKWA